MFDIGKDQSFASRGIPLGILEVNYPAEGCGRAALHALVERELAALRERYADYDRKAVFGENPYFRFFRKFKKTYPVMMQFESMLLKGREFPKSNAVTAVPFLAVKRPRPYSASFLPRAWQALRASSSGASLQITLSPAKTAPSPRQVSSQLRIHSPSPQP